MSDYKKTWLDQVRMEDVYNAFDFLVLQPFVEVFDAIFGYSRPLVGCAAVSMVLQLLVIFDIDFWFFTKMHWLRFYPVNWYLRFLYLIFVSGFSFYAWGFMQGIHRTRLMRQLTLVFENCGLKSKLGRYPSFIHDKRLDSETRVLRLKKNGTLKEQYKTQELKELLHVEIDRIEDDFTNGAVNIYYSHATLPEKAELTSLEQLHEDQFFIGHGRAQYIIGDFKDCPHFLVGGGTGFGKTTFINQMITTLYLKNKHYTFELVDLKEGTEFYPRFSNLPRVNLYDSSASAAIMLEHIAEVEIKNRMSFLKLNDCQTVDDLRELDAKKLKFAPHLPYTSKFDRLVIVVDEAHQLFLANNRVKPENASLAKNSMIKITALGRSAGVHVVIGTQRPDVKAVDALIKSNLQGRVCFHSNNNATSMTILDNARGSVLPDIKGRGIWKNGSDLKEIQALHLSKESCRELLSGHYRKEKSEVEDLEKATDAKAETVQMAQPQPKVTTHEDASFE